MRLTSTLRHFSVLMVLLLLAVPVLTQAQINSGLSTLDTWTRVNRGFAKCAPLGGFAGEAEWFTDDFSVDRMVSRRGEVFAAISYGANGSNTAGCGNALFRHDTLTNRWIKVASPPGGGGTVNLISNNTDIFINVGYPTSALFVLTEDLINFPTGWKRIAGFTGNELPGYSCRGSSYVGIPGDILDVVGDTIYILQNNPCNNPNQIMKFFVGGDQVVNPLTDISRDIIGDMPWQGITQNWLTESAGNHQDSYVSDLIAGSFRFFHRQVYGGNNLEVPYFMWAFDQRRMPANEYSGMQPFRSDMAVMNGFTYYVNDDGVNGYELWKSDGTNAGTTLVRDIYTNSTRDGAGGHKRYPKNFLVVGSTLYFTAYNGSTGYELWKTDGTNAGTVLVADIATGWADDKPNDSEPGEKVAIGSTFFFSARTSNTGRELYRSDGTAAGTALVTDLNPGSANSDPGNYLVVGTTLFYTATTASGGRELYMLASPYTSPVRVADIRSGSGSSDPASLTAIGTTIFFSADNGASGRELYKAVPPYTSVSLVSDIWAGATGSNPRNLYVFNNELFFAAADTNNGTELRRLAGPAYDATSLSMLSINAGSASSFPGQFTAIGDTLFFRAQTAAAGFELYKMGASNASLRLISDINSGASSSGPQYLTAVGGVLYFTAHDGPNGRELFRVGPAPFRNPQRIDIRFGTNSSDPHNLIAGPGNVLFFAANDGSNGDELWVYNGSAASMPRNSSRPNTVYGWRNISAGPDYGNLTGSSNPVRTSDPGYDPYDRDTWVGFRTRNGTINSWAPCSIILSVDKKQIYSVTQTGGYRWIGSGWEFVNGSRVAGFSLIPTNNGIYQTQRGTFRRVDGAVTTNVGNSDFFPSCVHSNVSMYTTPDDGKTWYCIKRDMVDPNVCGWGNGQSALFGIYRLRIKFDKIGATRNIHVSNAGYFGGDQDDDPWGVAFGGTVNKKSKILVAGNFGAHDATLKNRRPAVDLTINQSGYVTTTSSPAQVLRYNQRTDTLEQITYLGTSASDRVQGMESMNRRHPVLGKRIAVVGTFGLVCLDSMGRYIWHVTSANLPGNTNDRGYVDIDDRGHVAFMRRNGSNFDHKIRVYDENGQPVTGVTTVTREFAHDIAIKNDTVVVCGFRNGCLPGTGPKCNGASGNTGSCGGAEIQTAYIWYYAPGGGASAPMTRYAVTYDYPEGAQGRDIADTRGLHVNFGLDGKLYYLGESAGSESIYRWDGSQFGSVELNSVRLGLCDGNSSVPNGTISQQGMKSVSNADLSNTASAHIAFFGRLDISKVGPGNYVHVEKGDWMIPRLTDGKSNTMSVSLNRGYIHSGPDGTVYVLGVSAYQYAGRQVQKVNGKSIGEYAGDPTLYMTTPEFGGMRFWGTFSKASPVDGYSSSGEGRGVAVNDSLVVYISRITNRENHTFTPSQAQSRWNLGNSSLGDGYISLFYQNLSSFANRDSIVETVKPGDPIVNPDLLACRVAFTSNRTSACVAPAGVNQVTFTPTFTILNPTQYTGWTWKVRWSFGAGATVVSGNGAFNGTLNQGLTGLVNPTVTWSSDGLKTVSIRIVGTHPTQDSVVLEDIKYNLVNIFPASFALTSLIGPGQGCNQGVYIYEVTVPSAQAWAITSYTWSVPASATILNGQGTRRISVRMGASGGVVSVVGVTGCGNTPALTRNVTINTPVLQALVIADRMSLTAGEQYVVNDLTTRGYTITLREDNDLDSNDFLCKNIIILTSTVDPALVGSRFRNITTPVVVMHPGLLEPMNMVAAGNSGTTASQTQVNLTLIGVNDLKGNLSTGLLTVYRRAMTLGWGIPAASATVVTADPTNGGRSTYFAYAAGAAMANGQNAPARRVFIFPPNRTALDSLSANGQFLISRSLCWADNNCNLPVITTRPISRSVYTLYDSLGVTFTTSGTFNAGNQFIVQWSDANGDFTNFTNSGSLARTGTNPAGTVEVNPVPNTLVAGARYSLRVVSTNPVAFGSPITNITLRDILSGEAKIYYICNARQSRQEALAVSDTGMYNFLVRNFDLPVEYIHMNEVSFLRLAGAKLIVISSTADNSTGSTTAQNAYTILKNYPAPILTLTAARLQDQVGTAGLGLATANSNTANGALSRHLFVSNLTSPLTRGFDGHTNIWNVYGTGLHENNTIAISALGANAEVLSRQSETSTSANWFTYEKNVLLPGNFNSPARRAMFWYNPNVDRWNNMLTNGRVMLKRAITWCLETPLREITAATTTQGNTVCSGSTFNVDVQTAAQYREGNRFIVQLSGPTGDFNAPGFPVEVGANVSTLATSVAVTIPNDLAPGSNYRMRVLSTNPYELGPIVSDTLTHVLIDDRMASRRSVPTLNVTLDTWGNDENLGSNIRTTEDAANVIVGNSYGEIQTDNNSNGPTTTWTLTPIIPRTGVYEVQLTYPAFASNRTDARFTINHAGGTTVRTINQQAAGNRWISLGSYTFNAGQTHSVQVIGTSAIDQRRVRIDAIRFVRNFNGAANPAGSAGPKNLIIGNLWTGAVSSDWHNPANWSICGSSTGIPDSNTSVIIPAQLCSSCFAPVVSTGDAVAASILLNFGEGGNSLTVNNGRTLRVLGTITNGDTIRVLGTGAIRASGNTPGTLANNGWLLLSPVSTVWSRVTNTGITNIVTEVTSGAGTIFSLNNTSTGRVTLLPSRTINLPGGLTNSNAFSMPRRAIINGPVTQSGGTFTFGPKGQIIGDVNVPGGTLSFTPNVFSDHFRIQGNLTVGSGGLFTVSASQTIRGEVTGQFVNNGIFHVTNSGTADRLFFDFAAFIINNNDMRVQGADGGRSGTLLHRGIINNGIITGRNRNADFSNNTEGTIHFEGGRIVNNGTILYNAWQSSGDPVFFDDVENNGIIRLRRRNVRFRNLRNSVAGVIEMGHDSSTTTKRFQFRTLENAGTISIGNQTRATSNGLVVHAGNVVNSGTLTVNSFASPGVAGPATFTVLQNFRNTGTVNLNGTLRFGNRASVPQTVSGLGTFSGNVEVDNTFNIPVDQTDIERDTTYGRVYGAADWSTAAIKLGNYRLVYPDSSSSAADSVVTFPSLMHGDGNYQVEVYVQTLASRCTAVKYYIMHNGVRDSATVNQVTATNGSWVSLGTHYFRNSTEERLIMGGYNRGNCTMAFDGVRYTYVSGCTQRGKPGVAQQTATTLNNRNLTLTNGKYYLLGNNLTLTGTAAVNNANASRYVVTNGDPSGGRLTLPVGSGTVLFPIGLDTNYTPLSVGAAGGNAISATVVEGVRTGVTSGSFSCQNTVNRTWFVNAPSTITGATIRLQWDALNEQTGFTRASSEVYNGTSSFSTLGASSRVTTAPFAVEQTGITLEPNQAYIAASGPPASCDKTWIGTVSNDWYNGANWSPAGAPTASSSVVIPAAPNVAAITTGTAACYDLNITTGTVTMSGGTLQVNGNFNRSAAGTFAATGGTVAMRGASASSILNSNTFANLLIEKSAGVTMPNTITQVNGALTLASGGVLVMSADSAATNLRVRGNLVNNLGGRLTQNGGVLVMNGSTAQTLLGNMRLLNLQINNAAGVDLAGSDTLAGTLSFVTGNLRLGTDNLVMTDAATTSGASPASFIQANLGLNGGSVIRRVGSGLVMFPIGTSTYTPVTVSNGLNKVHTVRVGDGVREQAVGGAAITSRVVNRTWYVQPDYSGDNIIQDNLDASGITYYMPGGRGTVTNLLAYGGQAYEFYGGNNGDSAVVVPNIPTAGQYELFFFVPASNANNCNTLLYTVRHANGTNVISFTTGVPRLQWVSLGTYTFNAGSNVARGAIQVRGNSCGGGARWVIDAFRYDFRGAATPATVTLQWNTTEELTNFTTNRSRVSVNAGTGGSWESLPSTGFAGTNPKTAEGTGVTRYPYFTVGGFGSNRWTGAQDSSWNNLANWSLFIPDSTDDVEIPAVLDSRRFPSITSGTVRVRNLTLAGGQFGHMRIRGGRVEVHGNFDNTANATFRHTGGKVVMRGSTANEIRGNNVFTNLEVNNAAGITLTGTNTIVLDSLTLLGGRLTMNQGFLTVNNHMRLRNAAARMFINDGQLVVRGNLDNLGNGRIISGATAGSVALSGTTAQQVLGRTAFRDLVIANTSSAGVTVSADSLTISRDFTINAGGRLTMNSGNLVVRGNCFLNGTVNMTGSTTHLLGTSNQGLSGAAPVLGSLVINKTGGVVTLPQGRTTLTGNLTLQNGQLTLADQRILEVRGNLVMGTAGQLDLSAGAIELRGDLNNSAAGTINQTAGTLTMLGTTAARILGATTLNNLTINKPTAGNDTVTVTNLTVTSALTLTRGILKNAGGAEGINLNENATMTTESATARVVGRLVQPRTVSAAPVTWAGVGVAINPGTQDLGQVVVTRTNGLRRVNNSYVESPILPNARSIDVVWRIEPTTQPDTPVDLDLSWPSPDDNGNDPTIALYAYRRQAPYTGAFQRVGGALTATSRRATISAPGFSEWTLGDQNNPLPVELINFFGFYDKKKAAARLNWATASERQNYGFYIERSTDAVEFTSVGFVRGAGNSVSLRSYSYDDLEAGKTGIVYYRLRQVDYDGTTDFSNIIAIRLGDSDQPEMRVFPNPSYLIADIEGFGLQGKSAIVRLINVQGQEAFTAQVPISQGGSLRYRIENTSHLPRGMYVVKLITDTQVLTQKLELK